MAKKKIKKKSVSDVHGKAFIKASFNNVLVTISDTYGNALCWSSAGKNGFRGSKKGTAFAAGVAAEKALETAKKNHGLSSVDVYVSGIGLGRDAAVRAISTVGIRIDSIVDVTPVAHGGVRPKGERKP